MRNTLLLLFASSFVSGLQLLSCSENTRRRIFQTGLLVGTDFCLPKQANAAKGAKGAAELDFEYYVKDLLGGNAREGTVQASSVPLAPLSRTVLDPLLSLLLDDDCSQSCVASRALLEQVKASKNSDVTASFISEKMKDYRSKVSRSFATRAQWKTDHVSDQYYFDLTSYALWRTATDLLPKYADRDVFAREVGRDLYREAKSTGLLKTSAKTGDEVLLTSTVPCMVEILDLFKGSNFCDSYRIGADENDKKDRAIGFDEFDDEDLQSGTSVNCLVSVYSPATLGASLQITGEKSRFSPEFIGTTLAAMWESAGIKVSYETYFVDRVYRPNPKDYFPDEQLLQFTLVKNK